MRIIVQYSGGKDSQACLLWAVKKYGANKIEAVFTDTGWENPITYKHIELTTRDLGVKLTILKSAKYDGMIDLATKKKRFPSTKARFCTEELKVKPFIDFVLDKVNDNIIVIQGIRSDESKARSKMSKQCTMFKYYKEPYGYDKNNKPKKHSYRKKEVLAFTNKYLDDVLRPVFNWSAQNVIDYIINSNQKPNPLYKQGFNRVGCFPCIMANLNEIKQISNRYPKKIEEILIIEKELGSTFFPPDKIPKRETKNKSYPFINEVSNYINAKNATLDLFQTEKTSCMSFYSLCE